MSSAYYAVFHLLIAEATSNWNNVTLRAALSRAYDHATMKALRVKSSLEYARLSLYRDANPQVVASLRFVALTFTQLQEDRHFADYNLTEDLDPADALNQVKSAEKIFTTWPSVRSNL